MPGSASVPGLALPRTRSGEHRRTGASPKGAARHDRRPSPGPAPPSSPPPRAPCAPANPPRRLPPAPAWLRGRSSLGASRSGAAARSLPSKMAESLPEHDRILQEIESTDTACVGPTLRCGTRGPWRCQRVKLPRPVRSPAREPRRGPVAPSDSSSPGTARGRPQRLRRERPRRMRRGRAAPAAAPWGPHRRPPSRALRGGEKGPVRRGQGAGLSSRAAALTGKGDRAETAAVARLRAGRSLAFSAGEAAGHGPGGAGVRPRDGAAQGPALVAGLGAPAGTQCRALLPALGRESAPWVCRYRRFCAENGAETVPWVGAAVLCYAV